MRTGKYLVARYKLRTRLIYAWKPICRYAALTVFVQCHYDDGIKGTVAEATERNVRQRTGIERIG